MLNVPCLGDAAFDLDYAQGGPSSELYAKGTAKYWTSEGRIDWSRSLDPENPLDFDDRLMPLHGSGLWQGLTEKERGRVRFDYHTYWVSQLLHGEQAALLAASRLVCLLPDLPSKKFAAAQAAEEARHLEIFERLLRDHLGEIYPMGAGLRTIIEQGLGDRRWDMVVLGAQVVVEGMALSAFQQFRDASRNRLVRSVMAYVLEDEARHVAYGLALLPRAVSRLSAAERREREDYVIECVSVLSTASNPRPVWERSGLPVEECVAEVARSRRGPALPGVLLRRIPPILQRVGLWSVRVAHALEKMNVRPAKGVDLDSWMLGDEQIAMELERQSQPGSAQQ